MKYELFFLILPQHLSMQTYLLDCLRNHHSKKREQTTYQKEPAPNGRRLFHIGMWVCGEPLRRVEYLRLLF